MIGLAELLHHLNDLAWSLFLLAATGSVMLFLNRRKKDARLLQSLKANSKKQITLQSTPLVSILVAAWNEATMLETHIQCMLALSYPYIEYILCAGGVDGSYDIACRYAEAGVMVLEQLPGEGKQKALKRCLEQSSGEIIFLTDADCRLESMDFIGTLEKIINSNRVAATGSYMPLKSQLSSPLVVYQWSLQFYNRLNMETYCQGLLGANCAILRSALEASGGFSQPVASGTDYYLARQLLRAGNKIYAVPNSVVETAFQTKAGSYIQQQARWLRNLVLHSWATGDRVTFRSALFTCALGIAFLALPLFGILAGNFFWSIWLGMFFYSWLMRIHYLSLLFQFYQLPVFPGAPLCWLKLPLFMIVDWLAITRGLLESILPGWKFSW